MTIKDSCTCFFQLWLIGLCSFGSGNTWADPEKPVDPSPRILVLGDSLSAAYGIEAKQGWVALLQQRLNQMNCPLETVNASISGDTSYGGLTRLPEALQRHQPKLVIVQLGGNDGLRALSLAHFKQNLLEIIKLSRQAQAKVLLLGVKLPANYGKQFGEHFHNVYLQVAKESQTELLPFFLQDIAEDKNNMQADGIHPNQASQKKILENIWPKLSALLTCAGKNKNR